MREGLVSLGPLLGMGEVPFLFLLNMPAELVSAILTASLP